MSSHHIVRDEQEPALLLWQPGQIRYDQAGQLLEWSPRVVVHQQALSEALAWEIKLDAVWAAPHELEEVSRMVAHQQPVRVLALAAENPLEGVISWLGAQNQGSLNLMADAEADAFGLLRQLEGMQQAIQVQVLSQGWRYSYFSRPELRKWLPAESQLRVVAFASFPEVGGGTVKAVEAAKNLQEFSLPEAGVLMVKGASGYWLGEKL